MHRIWTALSVAAFGTFFLACGDDAPPSEDVFDTIRGEAVVLTPQTRALTVTLARPLARLSAQFADDMQLVENVVVVDQLFSEPTHMEVANGVGEASEPRFNQRMASLYGDDRLSGSLALATRTYWVVDLQRLDREWLVDWRGLERDTPENREEQFTVTIRNADHDGDYARDAEAFILGAFANAPSPPTSLVIGSDLEQQYLAAPQDWPALVALVRQLADAVRAEYPEVRVAAGINWSRFMQDVVPGFEEVGVTEEFGAVRAAWEAVIDPLYVTPEQNENGEVIGVTPFMDFYGFSLIPNPEVDLGGFAAPEDVPDEHFVGISQQFRQSPERALSVAFVRVGWPTQASSDFWARWFTRATAGLAGLDIEVLSWWGYENYEQSYCSSQILAAGGRRFLCNRGFYSESGASNDLYVRYFR